MAEFYLDCWNKISGSEYGPKCFYISQEPDFCEECGEWKPVIVCFKKRYLVAEWFRKRFKIFSGSVM